MANEFVIREGFTSKSGIIVTGSIQVLGGITGSLVSSSYAITASYAINSITASLTNTINSASYSINALTASTALLGLNVPSYAVNYTSTKLNPSLLTGSIGSIGYLSPLYGIFVTENAANNNRQPNTIYLTPIYINSDCKLTKIGIQAQRTTGTNTIRLGVYTNSGLMLPETKLVDEVINPGTTRLFYESTLATPVSMSAGEIYWVASMLCGTVAVGIVQNINYLSIQWTAGQWQNGPYNRLINPLLGSYLPTNQNAIEHISYYAYTTATTSSLQTTLPQTVNSYAVYAYGDKLTTTNNHTNAFVPPMLYVVYN